jgi:hypothetical protein
MFYAHPHGKNGLLNRCKACAKRDARDNYRKNIDLFRAYERKRSKDPTRKAKALEYQRKRRAEFPGKNRARNAVSNAIRDGKLTRMPCEVCGTSVRVQAHHKDYRKPLDIRWLCFKHHREIEHGQETAP